MEPFNISMNLFSSALRRNPLWEPAVTRLLESQGPHSRWRETNLETHDITLCLPGGFPGSQHFFHLILLCPDDMARAETPHRIEQLHQLEGGKNAAIVFLVDEEVTKGATLALTKLQVDILSIPALGTSSIPLIPVPTVLALPETLRAFQSSLVASRATRHYPRPQDVARDLVPHCVVGRPLSNKTTSVLIHSCQSIKDMVDALALEGSEASLASGLDGDSVEAERVVSFWKHEFGLQ